MHAMNKPLDALYDYEFDALSVLPNLAAACHTGSSKALPKDFVLVFCVGVAAGQMGTDIETNGTCQVNRTVARGIE